MILWFVGGSILLVANVFRSAGVDYRLVALGSALPLLIDLPFGQREYGHTLLLSIGTLAVVMLVTIGRARLVRRRLICIPIGMMCGLVLSGAWMQGRVLWWPTLGTEFPHAALLPAWWVVLILEVLGLVACWWVVGQFDLYERGPWQEFVHTGRLREHPVG